MNTELLWALGSTVVACGFVALLWVTAVARERHRSRGQVESALAERVRLETELGRMAERAEEAERVASDEARKRRGQFQQIEGILGERDDWKNMALQNGREHSVAQELMLRECERLAKLANKAVNPKLRQIADGYKRNFAGESPEAAKRITNGETPLALPEGAQTPSEPIAKPPVGA